MPIYSGTGFGCGGLTRERLGGCASAHNRLMGLKDGRKGAQNRAYLVDKPSTKKSTNARVEFVSPRIGDIHKVSNAFADRASISIHVYGANIGAVKRHIYEPDTERRKIFVSG